ncbi:hypothetical protein A4R26_00210 [Niastella populi]|uniref:DUF4239 domain-containing protein n=2 Tax=Niastella populi TaxID=550983 RepID=A0A1V9GCG6_9BACT|nr:hypothetical protein A4R26_00210 [Niastella populi]
MLEFPPLLLLIIIVLLFSLTGIACTYFFRRYVNMKPLRSHNELVGYIFATVGGFYGLLLGFVVFLVWDAVNEAQTNTNREGSIARALYRDIKFYPQPGKAASLKALYIDYIRSVVNEEFPEMEAMKPVTANNHVHFNAVFQEMVKLDKDAYFSEMFRQLNELAENRSLRFLDATSSIPLEIWLPLLMGGAIILIFAVLVDVESRRLHITANGLLGAFMGLVIYIIIILDHPFTGKLKIEPEAYKAILQMEKTDAAKPV